MEDDELVDQPLNEEEDDDGAGAGPDPKPDPMAAITARLDEMARDNRELREELRNSRTAAANTDDDEEEEEEEIELDDDLAALITANDGKGLKATLKSKLGLVDAKDVRKMVQSEASRIVKQTALYDAYPELHDNKSDFTKAVAAEYKKLSARHGEGLTTIQTATELVAERMGIEPEVKSRRRSSSNSSDEFEIERLRRVRGQQNNTGRRTRDAGGGDESDPQVASLVQKLRNAGGNITLKGVQARAAKGVQIGGLSDRGR